MCSTGQFPIRQDSSSGSPGNKARQSSLQSAPPLYVDNLDDNVTEDALYTLFSKFGIISSIKIMTNQTTNKALRYACISFVNRCDGITYKHSYFVLSCLFIRSPSGIVRSSSETTRCEKHQNIMEETRQRANGKWRIRRQSNN